jgi:hypothetical protein
MRFAHDRRPLVGRGQLVAVDDDDELVAKLARLSKHVDVADVEKVEDSDD